MRPVLLIFPPDLSKAVPEPQEPLLEEEARRFGYDPVDFSLTLFARSDRQGGGRDNEAHPSGKESR